MFSRIFNPFHFPVLLAFCLFLSGCGTSLVEDDYHPTIGTPKLSITSSQSNIFSASYIYSTAVDTVILTNNGTATASNIKVKDLSAPYSFFGGSYPGIDGTCLSSLKPGDSCILTISFSPAAIATYAETLEVTYYNWDSPKAKKMTYDLQSEVLDENIVTQDLIFHVDAARNTGSRTQGTGCSGSQLTWKELSGQSSDGTLTGFSSCGSNSGWNGNGTDTDPYRLDLNKTSSDWVDFGSPASLPIGYEERTMCGWAYTNTFTGSGPNNYAWIASYGERSANQAMFIGRGGDSLGVRTNTGNILNGGGFGAGEASDVTVNNFWSVNQWNFVCLTYDGTTAKLYANGSLLSTQTKNWNLHSSWSLRLGRQIGVDDQFWNGGIAAFYLYNRALTADEVSQNCNALKHRFPNASCQ